MYRGSKLYIPLYQDEKIILKQQKKQRDKQALEKLELQKERRQKINLIRPNKGKVEGDSAKELASESESEDEAPPEDKMNSPNYILNLKQKMFYLVLLGSSIFLTFMFFISLTTIYNDNLILFFIIYLFIEMLIIWFLKSYLLKEMLLVAPILSAFELIQVISLHSKNLDYYYQLNVYRLLMISLFRIIIDPFINSMRIYKQKLRRILQKKAEIDEQYRKYLKYFTDDSSYDTQTFENYTGANYEIREEVPKEIILISLLSFTTKACMNAIRSLLILIYYILNDEINLGKYTQTTAEYGKYILASFFISLIQIFVDVIALYLIEMIHDFHIFDYINFCRYRYLRRKSDWLMDNITFDTSIGVGRVTRVPLAGLPGLQQPVLLPGLVPGAEHVFDQHRHRHHDRLELQLLQRPFQLHLPGHHHPLPRDLLPHLPVHLEARPFLEARAHQLPEVLPHDAQAGQLPHPEPQRLPRYPSPEEFILNSFICRKKNYLIRNLDKIIAKPDFYSRNGFLLKIYKLLADSVRKEQIDILMTQIVEKNRFHPRVEPLLEENGIVISSRRSFIKLMTMLHHWHFLGKEMVYFRGLIAGVAQENLKRICSTCSSDENLFPVAQRDFYDILKEYRAHLRGLISYASLWVTFYRKRQSFKTLCKECKLIEEIKKFKKQDRKRSYMKSEIDNSQLKNLHDQPIFKEITKEEIRLGTLRLLFLWHSTAKSNLLHQQKKFEPFLFSQFKSLIEE